MVVIKQEAQDSDDNRAPDFDFHDTNSPFQEPIVKLEKLELPEKIKNETKSKSKPTNQLKSKSTVQSKKKKKKSNKSYDFGTSRRNAKCSYCNKYYERSRLREHQFRTHLSKFDCDFCGTSYKRKYQLLAHILNHINARQEFPCTLCDKKFLIKHSLKLHLNSVHYEENEFGEKVRVEKKPKPIITEYNCQYCNKLFKGKGAKGIWKRHEEKVHDNGRITQEQIEEAKRKRAAITYANDCPVCHETFDNWRQRYRHEVKMHREMNPDKEQEKKEYICDYCGYVRFI